MEDCGRLTVNPAYELAGSAVMSGQMGPIKEYLEAAAKIIGKTKGGMSKEQRAKALGLLREHGDAVKEAERLLSGVRALHKATMTKKPLAVNSAGAADITYGVPELFPVNKPRGTGERVDSVEEALNHPGVYTRDVIQQTPMPEKDVDSVNVVTTCDKVVSSKAPTGEWAAAPDNIKDRVQWISDDPPRGVVLELKEEVVEITLTAQASTVIDTANGRVAGQRVHDDAGGSVDISTDAVKRCAENARLFRKTGHHADVLGYCMTPDAVTAKVDGEALQVVSGTGKRPKPDPGSDAYAVSRAGSIWAADIDGRYEDEGRTRRIVRITLEVFPSISAPERVFLVDADVFGVGNAQGFSYIAEVLRRKRIVLSLGGARIDLELACLCRVPPSMADGIVLHNKRRQSFVKGRISVDLEPGNVKNTVKGMWRVEEGPDGELPGVSEYRARRDAAGQLTLNYHRPRRDKLRGNKLSNIVSLMGQMDAYAIAESVTERLPARFKWCVHQLYGLPGACETPHEGGGDLLSYTWELVEKSLMPPRGDSALPGEDAMYSRELDRLAADEGDVGPYEPVPGEWLRVAA